MPTRELRAESLGEFEAITSNVRAEWDPGNVSLWFRGQGSSEWLLTPKFQRMIPVDSNLFTEDEMREEFAMRGRIRLVTRPTDDWDWYVLMQHHSAATRLLDWTEGSLLGLYFAVSSHIGSGDAAVWVLDPWDLNEKVIGRDEVIPVGEPGVSKRDQQLIQPWLPARFPKSRRRLPAR